MLNAEDKKRMNEIVCNAIVRNMKEGGLTYKQAKTGTFNRLNKEHPEFLKAFIHFGWVKK